jgi:hypothetical protein
MGSGPTGRLAALDDETRRAERRAAREKCEAELLRLEAAEAAVRRLEAQCMLLVEAVLFACGLRRLNRHGWRTWRVARKVIAGAPR